MTSAEPVQPVPRPARSGCCRRPAPPGHCSASARPARPGRCAPPRPCQAAVPAPARPAVRPIRAAFPVPLVRAAVIRPRSSPPASRFTVARRFDVPAVPVVPPSPPAPLGPRGPPIRPHRSYRSSLPAVQPPAAPLTSRTAVPLPPLRAAVPGPARPPPHRAPGPSSPAGLRVARRDRGRPRPRPHPRPLLSHPRASARGRDAPRPAAHRNERQGHATPRPRRSLCFRCYPSPARPHRCISKPFPHDSLPRSAAGRINRGIGSPIRTVIRRDPARTPRCPRRSLPHRCQGWPRDNYRDTRAP